MKYLVIIFSIFLFQGCFDLDENLYNPDDTISEYLFDEYQGEIEIDLPESYDIPVENVHLMTIKSDLDGDIKDIYAVYLGAIENIKMDTVIMYCHGNAGHMDNYWDRAKLLYHSGNQKGAYGVMMIDYRGFGLSDGDSSESGLVADVHSALEWLKTNGLDDERTIIYGYSLGSIPAIAHCANPTGLKPSKLILENPIGSIETMVQDASSLSMPTSFFADLQTNNIELIKSVDQPLLWLAGDKDDFLYYKTHGQEIYDNHTGTFKNYKLIENAHHSNLPAIFGFEEYATKMGQFIKQ